MDRQTHTWRRCREFRAPWKYVPQQPPPKYIFIYVPPFTHYPHTHSHTRTSRNTYKLHLALLCNNSLSNPCICSANVCQEKWVSTCLTPEGIQWRDPLTCQRRPCEATQAHEEHGETHGVVEFVRPDEIDLQNKKHHIQPEALLSYLHFIK